MRFRRHRDAARRDDDGARRGHRRERRRARLPPPPHPQRPWRQQRHHRRARLDARPSPLRQGAHRVASPISSSRARRSRSCANHAPGGMGHACEFETAMMQHLRPDLVADRAGGGHLSGSGLRLSHDRPARQLGGAHLPRFRRSFGERHARRSVARDARKGKALLRGLHRSHCSLRRGLFPLANPAGGALMRTRGLAMYAEIDADWPPMVDIGPLLRCVAHTSWMF